MRVSNIRIISLGIHSDTQGEVSRVDWRRDAVVGEPRQLLGALRPRPAGLGCVPGESRLFGDHLQCEGLVTSRIFQCILEILMDVSPLKKFPFFIMPKRSIFYQEWMLIFRFSITYRETPFPPFYT